ncbi:hypothetical protein CPB84DRAFT_720015 [Gymnopilus junonius]|uniref:Uncharacterized protein n=1 Tax=Gymnopilus junonius TaxID=109634 RepID=A0A9P5NTU1_GYMJU|nr:hypothetical protein CPB84DRAFT_720015 [Gymnopilus junonius]
MDPRFTCCRTFVFVPPLSLSIFLSTSYTMAKSCRTSNFLEAIDDALLDLCEMVVISKSFIFLQKRRYNGRCSQDQKLGEIIEQFEDLLWRCRSMSIAFIGLSDRRSDTLGLSIPKLMTKTTLTMENYEVVKTEVIELAQMLDENLTKLRERMVKISQGDTLKKNMHIVSRLQPYHTSFLAYN